MIFLPLTNNLGGGAENSKLRFAKEEVEVRNHCTLTKLLRLNICYALQSGWRFTKETEVGKSAPT